MTKGMLRKFEVRDLVLERIPGLDSKLQESWRGLYKVLECFGEVNYRIGDMLGKKKRVVLINALKCSVERIQCVRRIVLSTEEEDVEISRVELAPVFLDDFNEGQLQMLLQ